MYPQELKVAKVWDSYTDPNSPLYQVGLSFVCILMLVVVLVAVVVVAVVVFVVVVVVVVPWTLFFLAKGHPPQGRRRGRR